jgi:Tol biopolymer transport system component
MPTNDSNYFHASVSPDGQEIVFISDMNGRGNQVYLGALADPYIKEFEGYYFLS